ncbi:MAG: BREX-1 system adenine-specific DNA-methyltransferase PglX [Eubacteriales bacterium]
MDKNAIKKYAIWAREELIKRVSTKAEEYEIRANAQLVERMEAIGDRVLTSVEKKQRTALVRIVKEKGFEFAMEEAAYTWFNRFIALRFMEVNGYLPSKVRVFTDAENNFKPQILDEAIHMELDGLDLEKVLDLKEQNETDELYKYLIITQCNALHSVLPKMFPKIGDYTQLLFPDNILRDGSAIEQMIAIIPEEDWKDAVQILGWLYQYYNSVPKDTVFANLKKNIKISKENIPAATQLFTPDWIVRYMVENSLGRIAVDKFGVDPVSMGWKYYLPEAEQTEEVQNQLRIINSEKTTLEELKVIDPCMGSGHILVYAFDVLVQIYENQGYTARDAVVSILENNLFGLDIDERAYQLSYFALMMKARSYDRRFLTRGIEPQVYCPKGYEDGEEYGSLLNVDVLEEKPKPTMGQLSFDTIDDETQLNTWNFRRLLNQKYDVVVTNPPYMGSKGMSAKLSKYVQEHYGDSKSDMFAVFIERALEMAKQNGYSAMITQHAFMFLSSYEKLRGKLLHTDIINMAHLGARAFEEIGGEVVQTVSWVMRKSYINNYKGIYKRLVDFNSQYAKEEAFLADGNLHIATQGNFSKIPGSPIAYWVSEKMFEALELKNIKGVSNPCLGMRTGDNDRFLRFWYEVELKKTSCTTLERHLDKKWIPYNKGGGFRRWYGLNEYLVNWKNHGYEIKENTKIKYGENISWKISNEKLYFLEGITWGSITSGTTTFRYYPKGFIFSNSGQAVIMNEEYKNEIWEMVAYLNSNVVKEFLKILSPTLGCESGYIAKIPYTSNLFKNVKIKELSLNNTNYAKTDWDSFETSWDFEIHPFIKSYRENSKFVENGVLQGRNPNLLQDCYIQWRTDCNLRFETLKRNEEELNRIFIDIYGLQDELTPEVEDKDVTVRLADKTRDVKSFISYAVGCMFGRYSILKDGLIYAGGEWPPVEQAVGIREKYYPNADQDIISWTDIYADFIPDLDNVIPICDDEYFEDDIVGRFVEFVKVVYGAETLEENLDFIAGALSDKGASRDIIRKYFLNGFYADHCKVYSKRPIYWQLESGKKNGFKALIYMHRYAPDTMARVRTDYVHEQQGRYRTAIADLERRTQDASTSERVKLTKQLTALKDQEAEIRVFEEKVHHLADQMIRIDLDDGVKNNYNIFSDVLTKIK